MYILGYWSAMPLRQLNGTMLHPPHVMYIMLLTKVGLCLLVCLVGMVDLLKQLNGFNTGCHV